MKKEVTYKRMHELLDYNSGTGIFIRKLKYNKDGKRNKWSGKAAGCLQSDGYIQIRIDGKKYLAHRLAWLFVHGYFPEYQIGHINRIKNDNRVDNLREATQSCNSQNQKIQKNNTSGVPGVYWDKQTNKWRVRIMKNNKDIYLGRFDLKLDAAKAKRKAELKYHTCIVKSLAQEYIDAH